MHAPDFKGKLIRTAKELLTDIVKDIAKDKKHLIKGKTIFNFSTALDEAKEHMATPPNTARTMEDKEVKVEVEVSPREAEVLLLCSVDELTCCCRKCKKC